MLLWSRRRRDVVRYAQAKGRSSRRQATLINTCQRWAAHGGTYPRNIRKKYMEIISAWPWDNVSIFTCLVLMEICNFCAIHWLKQWRVGQHANFRALISNNHIREWQSVTKPMWYKRANFEIHRYAMNRISTCPYAVRTWQSKRSAVNWPVSATCRACNVYCVIT